MNAVPAVEMFGDTFRTVESVLVRRTVVPPVGAGAPSEKVVTRCSPEATDTGWMVIDGVVTVTVTVPLFTVVMTPGIDAVTVAVPLPVGRSAKPPEATVVGVLDWRAT